jgi:hypothetical protein
VNKAYILSPRKFPGNGFRQRVHDNEDTQQPIELPALGLLRYWFFVLHGVCCGEDLYLFAMLCFWGLRATLL